MRLQTVSWLYSQATEITAIFAFADESSSHHFFVCWLLQVTLEPAASMSEWCDCQLLALLSHAHAA